ncbi:MAG: FkbM family methyltransferase [Proteobacteria bacterium]|nr:FkbM family methyltransferase [Pseudomonadota bacterium]
MRAKRLQRAWFAFADKSAFLRKLFLWRKTYLIKHRGTHYSQWGEDVVLEGFMAKGPPPAQGCYIDVEGHEEAVLRSLDFARYRPALILVETHAPTLARMQQEGKYRLLTQELGYELVNWTGLTAFFRDAAATP